MIRLSFNSTDQRLLAGIRARWPGIQSSVVDTMDSLMLELQRSIQLKLQGIVLAHRSGKLAASIIKEPTVVRGNTVVGSVTGAAGPAFYGKIQEKGGTRTYEILPVHAKALAFFPTGSIGGGGGIASISKSLVRGLYTKSGVRAGRLKQSSYGRFGEYGGIVVTKVIHPPLPPRPFMKPSLDEMQETIVTRLKSAVVRGAQGV